MKKIFILLLMIFFVGQIQSVYAQPYSIGYDVEEVRISYSSPYLNECGDIYSGYTTTNKNEVKMITHFLESLTQIKGGGVPTDSKQICITLKYDSGDSKRFDIYPTRLNVIENTNYSIYQFPITEYYRMCDFINSLILDKFDNDIVISTEPSKWAEPHIDKAITVGIVPKWNQIGYTNYIQRVEVCQLVYNLFTISDINKDVSNDYTYLKEYPFNDTKDISIKELYIKGIVRGKSETEFCPYDYITREEFSRILSAAYKMVAKDELSASATFPYKDKAQISDWAVDSVEAVTSLGLMQGDENGNFNPKDNITKEQVIVTLLNLSNLHR